MSVSRSVGFVYDDVFLEHLTPPGHPERPDRLRAIVQHLRQCGLWNTLRHIVPFAASDQQLITVHAREHIEYVKSICTAGGGLLDEGDTHASIDSFEVALHAAGAVLAAIDAVAAKTIDTAFCAIRPPGHHAEYKRPMGFCIFNNVAVGARYAQQKHNLKKVAIVDWDVHHGNGTQHIFEADPSVLYISLHQYPFYPGKGARSERGIGEGEGYTLNIPLPAGTGEERYLQAFREEVVPALAQFKPDLLMISAGFDAHKDDPLAGMKLTDGSFAAMTAFMNEVSANQCEGRIVSVLEGGYNLEALAASVEAHLRELQKLAD